MKTPTYVGVFIGALNGAFSAAFVGSHADITPVSRRYQAGMM